MQMCSEMLSLKDSKLSKEQLLLYSKKEMLVSLTASKDSMIH